MLRVNPEFKSDSARRHHRLLMGGLFSITLSAMIVLLLYVSAVLGSANAADTLMLLSLPKFNPFALFIPDQLGDSRYGMELILGASMLLLATALFAAWAVLTKLTKR